MPGVGNEYIPAMVETIHERRPAGRCATNPAAAKYPKLLRVPRPDQRSRSRCRVADLERFALQGVDRDVTGVDELRIDVASRVFDIKHIERERLARPLHAQVPVARSAAGDRGTIAEVEPAPAPSGFNSDARALHITRRR